MLSSIAMHSVITLSKEQQVIFLTILPQTSHLRLLLYPQIGACSLQGLFSAEKTLSAGIP